MQDLHELLGKEYESAREDMRAYGEELRGKRKKIGPRQAKALRDYILDQDAGTGLMMVNRLYEVAKHTEGERTPCAACRFLEGK